MPELKDTALAKGILDGFITSTILYALMPINIFTFIFGILIIIADVFIAIKTTQEGDFKLILTILLTSMIGDSKSK